MSEVAGLLSSAPMGTFDAQGNYTPRQVTEDNMVGTDLSNVVGDTILEFDDGDLVKGTVVKIDRDEVLLDIGFKSEGVIPSRELSIRNDVNPSEIVSLGEQIEALVLQKEDKEGRLVLSKKRAQYEKAWANIEESKAKNEVVSGLVIEVVKGGETNGSSAAASSAVSQCRPRPARVAVSANKRPSAVPSAPTVAARIRLFTNADRWPASETLDSSGSRVKRPSSLKARIRSSASG